jgi:type I restriction enzyme S subunit
MSTDLVSLKDALRLSIDSVAVERSESYPIAGVYSFGRGLLSRAPILGSETTYKTLNRLHKDDFVLSQLKAWEGALAKVTSSHDGWFLSPQFPTFRAIKERLDISYLDWYCKQAKVWENLRNTARGMGARRDSVSPERFLSLQMPLPPLPEQRRIVARIEELVAKINEARALRHQTSETAKAFWERGASTVLNVVGHRHTRERLADLVTIRGGGTPSKVNPYYWDGRLPWITPKDMKVREISDSIDHISEQALRETTAKLIEPGAVLVVVRGMILAHTFPSAVLRVPAVINQDMKALIPILRILPEFLCTFLWATNAAILDLVEKSTHDTRKLETEKLLAIDVPVPPVSDQRQIVEELGAMQTRVEKLQKLQAETSAELGALLPSILDKAFKGEL